MALKFGRSTPKTTDPQGNRVADPDVYGKEVLTGTVSSWPDVKKMFQAGKLKKSFEGYVGNPEVMDYLTGKTDKLSDVEFEEPILYKSQDIDGSYQGIETSLKRTGKKHKALAEKSKWGFATGIQTFESNQKLSDNQIASYTGSNLDQYRIKATPAPAAVVTPAPVAVATPAPAVVTEDKPKPPAVVVKPTKIDQKPLGKLIPAKEDVTWNAPDLDKRKKASYNRSTKITPSKVTATGRRVDTKIGIHNAAIRKQSDAVSPQRIKYNTEQRRSAAYYGDSTSTNESITGKNESELRQLKKETRGEAGMMLKAGRLGSALTIGKDLSQIRKATRYAKDADLSVNSKGITVEGEGSNLRYFTPERTKKVTQDGRQVRGEGAMAGYKEFQAQEKDKAFRAQSDNPANRNNMSKKLADVATAAAPPTSSFSSSVVTRGQMKDKFATANPTASPRQVRQGVRAEAAANKQLIKSVVSKQKAKQ
jgi:hypothetical protein